MDIEFKSRLLDNNWPKLSALYLDAGMGYKSEERLARVFGNSEFQSFLYIEGQLVGAARAFTDGGDCAVLCDVSVLKVYQSNGLGRKIITHLMSKIPSHERIMLFCTPGLEKYYEEFGFGKMTTGMCMFKDQEDAISSGYIVSA